MSYKKFNFIHKPKNLAKLAIKSGFDMRYELILKWVKDKFLKGKLRNE
jgi:hypothetical protein